MIAFAFLCLISEPDCENNYLTRAIVGQGNTEIACFLDASQGIAQHPELETDDKTTVLVICKKAKEL